MGIKGRKIVSEIDLIQFQDLIYEKSKQGKPFYNIIDFMSSEQVIMKAIHNIKSNHGSKTAGVDGKTINDYLKMDTDELLTLIREQLKNYEPQVVLRRYIDKINGNKRPLGIPVMLDRIIQELTKMALEPFFEAKFYNHSYGYRPYRNAEHAEARIISLINSKAYIAIEGDIKGFFDNIRHNKLIDMLWGYGIRDKRLLTLMKKMLRSSVYDNGEIIPATKGTPQGGIISPLLANIYLNGFDWLVSDLWESHPAVKVYVRNRNGKTIHEKYYGALNNKKNAHHEKVHLIRFADDWVVLCKSEEFAQKFLIKLRKYFQHKLGLELSEEKTHITDCRTKPIKFLGFKIIAERKRLTDRIVGKAFPDWDRVKSKVEEIRKLIYNLRTQPNKLLRIRDIETINSKIIGLTNYYSIAIAKSTFDKIDQQLYYVTKSSFKRLYRRNSKEHRKKLSQLSNRINRHEGYNFITFAEDFENDTWIGITIASLTKVKYAEPFNPNWSYYTARGRESWHKAKQIPRKWYLEDIWTNYEHLGVRATLRGPIYNFEYWMNRQYVIKRDKAKCQACKNFVYPSNVHIHQRRPYIGINRVNKVSNLLTLCKDCHKQIHGKVVTSDVKTIRKINKLIEELRVQE
ncbi:group II intron reverse transcriptase/maturase [Cytobacillus firmus]|uniref:group II intron reverse transcriptase/maturase n=1 Tax=Cytobacillus firmus TaxID=1399 RepID=UPI0018CEC979|nr:group II intron reverse transcriptase/maturase [Cytobacillus firmus]MBG9587660.1 reverse transcriptase [Cytobacillus firmus]